MQHDARDFQEAWGNIISGNLDFSQDSFMFRIWADEGRLRHVLNVPDILPTLQHLSDCALKENYLLQCFHVVAKLKNREEAEFNELDFLQQRLTSTDPKVREAAALHLINRSKSESSQARVISARMSVTEALADLFCNFEMKSLSSKTTLSELLNVIIWDFGRNCSLTSQKVLPCAFRALRTAQLDPDADKYVEFSLFAVAQILRNNSILDINYMSILNPHQFCSFFNFLWSSRLSWDVIDGVLDLPREKLGDTNLTSLFLQPKVLNALRQAFSTSDDEGAFCGWILDVWYKLVVLEPSAVLSMIRLDFLGDTILHTISSDASFDDSWAQNASFFGKIPPLMNKMLDVSMQGTIDYFFSRGFIKNLAATIKLPTHLAGILFPSWDFEPLGHVIRCFEDASPQLHGSAVAVAFDNKLIAAATPSAGPSGVTTANSETDIANGCPAWAYDPTYDPLVTPIPIDNLEAFAAASGNTYIASFFVDLLAPTPNDEALSHDEQWSWLINPNPVCLAVMRHLLHDKPATKKALFAAAGIHELSRNARDFEPHPDDPGQSYYRDADGNDVCERPE